MKQPSVLRKKIAKGKKYCNNEEDGTEAVSKTERS